MDAAEIVSAYVKIRDAKEALVRKHEEELGNLTQQLETLEEALLQICKDTGQEGGKTIYGSFSRTIKSRYWTNDWDSMYKFIKEHDVPELLEKRIHQSNFKSWLEANPDKLPAGTNVDSKFSITVRRSK